MAQHTLDTASIVPTELEDSSGVEMGRTTDGDGYVLSAENLDDLPTILRVRITDPDGDFQSADIDADQARHIATVLMAFVEGVERRNATL
ncbi:hypothetical protein ACWEQ4_00750 [Rhodococcus sp. NPDC003994]